MHSSVLFVSITFFPKMNAIARLMQVRFARQFGRD
jgi:hypothetical protein